MPEFTVYGALFPQKPEDLKSRLGDRYDPSKNYPQVDGVLNIPADQAEAVAEYIKNGKPIGDRLEIPVGVSGWKKQSAGGKNYISLMLKPHYKYEEKPVGSDGACAVKESAPAGGDDFDDLIPF